MRKEDRITPLWRFDSPPENQIILAEFVEPRGRHYVEIVQWETFVDSPDRRPSQEVSAWSVVGDHDSGYFFNDPIRWAEIYIEHVSPGNYRPFGRAQLEMIKEVQL